MLEQVTQPVLAFLQQFLGNPALVAFVLGGLPLFEMSMAAIYVITIAHRPELIVFGTLGNFCAVIVLLSLWDVLNVPWWGEKILGKRLEKRVQEMAKHHEEYGVLGIALFVGIPFPLTGVYTGTLVARLLGIPKRQILLGSAIGVCMSTVVAYIGVTAGINLLLAG